jgi:hypothetical protein
MRDGKNWHMIHNSKKGKAYDGMRRPFFSPDSQTIAYPAVRGGKMCMVVNKKLQKTYETVGLPFFSPDSKHLVYQAKKEGRWLLVVNGKECKLRFDGFVMDYPVIVSEDGCHVLAMNTVSTAASVFEKQKKEVLEFFRYEVKF